MTQLQCIKFHNNELRVCGLKQILQLEVRTIKPLHKCETQLCGASLPLVSSTAVLTVDYIKCCATQWEPVYMCLVHIMVCIIYGGQLTLFGAFITRSQLCSLP